MTFKNLKTKQKKKYIKELYSIKFFSFRKGKTRYSTTIISLSHLKIAMNSLTAEIGSRGYNMYRETIWRNTTLHQQVKVLKETNSKSIDTNVGHETDLYCCKIKIIRVDKNEFFPGLTVAWWSVAKLINCNVLCIRHDTYCVLLRFPS